MTAIEDFMAEHDGLRLAVIPIFFGCGLLWPESAPWSDAVAEIVEPWDRNPILERVEKARVTQLVQRHSREQEIDERFEHSGKLEGPSGACSTRARSPRRSGSRRARARQAGVLAAGAQRLLAERRRSA